MKSYDFNNITVTLISYGSSVKLLPRVDSIEQIQLMLKNLPQMNGQQDLINVLRFINRKVYTYEPNAKDKRLVILITTSSLKSELKNKVLPIVRHLTRKNVDIVTLGIGSDIEKKSFIPISGTEDRVVAVDEIDKLPDSLGMLERTVGKVLSKLLFLIFINIDGE